MVQVGAAISNSTDAFTRFPGENASAHLQRIADAVSCFRAHLLPLQVSVPLTTRPA